MDGTLIDSEPYWIAAETELATRFGVTWTHEDGLSMVGKPLPESGAVLRERGVRLEIDQIVASLTERVTDEMRRHIPWQEDAKRLLEEVVAAGIPCALVTMSYAPMAQTFVEQLPDAFQVIVTGDVVTHGKPHPEPYLTAARELGVDISSCVAIEDSPPGVGSAHASGAATIAVRRVVDVEERPGVTVVDSLDDWNVDRLSAVLGAHA